MHSTTAVSLTFLLKDDYLQIYPGVKGSMYIYPQAGLALRPDLLKYTNF
jgi:hypothetical protein